MGKVELDVEQVKELLSGYSWYVSYWGQPSEAEESLMEVAEKAIDNAV